MLGCLWYHFMFIDEGIWFMGLIVFLLLWIICVPIIITSRLEKIIELLKKK